jgi:acryloyl-coenzyme A reductase
MRALVLEEPGEKPQLAIRDLPVPEPGPDEVLVKVAASGMCYHDVLVMRGILRRGIKPNIVLGHEISGHVAKIGSSVTTVSEGDLVASILTDACGFCDRCRSGKEHRCRNGQGIGHTKDGGFAEYVKIREFSLVVLPPNLNSIGASLLGCPIGVALQALSDIAKLQLGETTLITGAGGGLGVHLTQIAKSMGSRVLAVTTSPEKIDRLEHLGADEVILADELDFSEIARALTNDEGVDVVINCVGGTVFNSCLNSLAQFGRMVVLGDLTGDSARVAPAEILFRDAVISGSSGTSRENLRQAAQLVNIGKVEPTISGVFTIDEASKAYEMMLNKESFGRVALTP